MNPSLVPKASLPFTVKRQSPGDWGTCLGPPATFAAPQGVLPGSPPLELGTEISQTGCDFRLYTSAGLKFHLHLSVFSFRLFEKEG